MKTLAAHRRNPIAIVVILLLGLTMTGSAYAAMRPSVQPPVGTTTSTASADEVEQGRRLFLANCATCHGTNAGGNGTAGPSLVGVGAAAVDFQVSTGRMPLAAPGVQAPANDAVLLSEEQIDQLGFYVASLGPGPAIPDEEYLDLEGADIANGGKLFRTNCAMCHNSSGAGGALTRGKYAPGLMGVEEVHIYEAMLTGPQSMPVFNDENLSPQDKEDVIAFLKNVEDGGNAYGGHALGSLGPAGDALFVWTFGAALLVGAAIWIGRKAA